jgi:endonuclease YncB( thermonuclease family)
MPTFLLAAALVACPAPTATDGDTIRCKGQATSVRLAGIDAPDKSCVGRKAGNCYTIGERGDWTVSKTALQRMLRRGLATIKLFDGTTYGRRIAVVCVGGRNLNAAMVDGGFAIYKSEWSGAGVRFDCD